MNDTLETPKKALLYPELYERNPLWFRGAIAHRLLRIMTPKPLTRRLPGILRRPVFYPAFFFPPDWTSGDPLPPGISLPPGVSLPPDWGPGDPLPEGTIIDESIYLPEDWQPGDPPPAGTLPDPTSFTDIPGIDSPIPPIYTTPTEIAGPTHPYTAPPAVDPWYIRFDNTYWVPWGGRGVWNAALNRWDAVSDRLCLEVIGDWADGFRPTKLRVTHEGTAYTDIMLSDDDDENIVTAPNTPSGTELDLVFDSAASTDDLMWLYVEGDDPHATNIEFYSL